MVVLLSSSTTRSSLRGLASEIQLTESVHTMSVIGAISAAHTLLSSPSNVAVDTCITEIPSKLTLPNVCVSLLSLNSGSLYARLYR
jgi:hypothetical protein